jgi:signal transduction histidine kinase
MVASSPDVPGSTDLPDLPGSTDLTEGPGVTGSTDPGAPTWEDAVSAAIVFALGVLLIALGASGMWSDAPRWLGDDASPWLHLVPLALGCGAMVVKRRLPLTMLGVGILAVAADWVIGGSVAMIVVLFDLLYAATAYSSPGRRRLVVRGVVVVIVGTGVVSLIAGAPLQLTVLLVLQTIALLVVPVWWALNVVQKAELAALAEGRAALERDRADALERVAAADRAQAEQVAATDRTEAVAAERARMARDLHDTIAGQLSVIAIRAEASLAHPPDPVRDRESLAVVRESAVRSLGEMRQMIGLLRDGGSDPLATAPGLERLGELVEDSRRSGIDVHVDPPRSFARVGPPSAVEQAAYRVVQESIVNAGKHAPGSIVTVRIVDDLAGGRLVVEVSNPVGDLEGAVPFRPTTSSGFGLVTMRERTLALGGVFAVGRAEGSWVVRAEFPTRSLGGRT